ncbi:DUF4436 family protein [Dyella acidiphila]|uniref:DUF4436 family protein n=1 Tax=Dyella acidiphila TaxID=2775866 RepID=A0ABR9G690_9GAMM|nr:DUF4436 family protein [Dyella acidiphila]MBE1159563.1 DUF4436 family protein [Dyella acidiphila]
MIEPFTFRRFRHLLIAALLLCPPLLPAQDIASAAAHTMITPEGLAATGNKPVIDINLVSFDPIIGDVQGRLTVVWPKSMLTKDFGLYRDVRLLEGDSINDSIWDMRGNEPFVTFNSTIKTLSEVDGVGSPHHYPFDVHRIHMKIGLVTPSADGQGWQPLPFEVDCTKCSFEGFSVTTHGHFDKQGYYSVQFTMHRTRPAMAFAIGLNVVMVLIAFIVLIMALRISRSDEAPEIASLGFIGGLLFAMPAVRDLQPRIPSMGLMIDYLGFFWAEGFLAVALLIVMVCWLKRGKTIISLKELD